MSGNPGDTHADPARDGRAPDSPPVGDPPVPAPQSHSPGTTTFTFRERFVASEVWMPIWILASVGVAFSLLFRALEPNVTAFWSPKFVLLAVFSVLATFIVTFMVSAFLVTILSDGMLERQARRNGGPFSIGDRVVVIRRPHAGRSGTITRYGQCRSLQVTFDGEHEPHGAYSGHHLKRIAEPAGPTGSAADAT